jgi:hypothetical protein
MGQQCLRATAGLVGLRARCVTIPIAVVLGNPFAHHFFPALLPSYSSTTLSSIAEYLYKRQSTSDWWLKLKSRGRRIDRPEKLVTRELGVRLARTAHGDLSLLVGIVVVPVRKKEACQWALQRNGTNVQVGATYMVAWILRGRI